MEISKIWFDSKKIFLRTKEGVEESMPLEWFPRLLNATAVQRENFELSPFGIHWPELDEDLSYEGFSKFKKDEIKV